MARRKVRGEDEARVLLEGFASSGMDLAAWARARGVDGRSLGAWQINLARGQLAHDGPMRVVELIPSGAHPRSPPIIIRCGPFAVEVPDDADEAHLGRVLAVVAAC